MSTAHLSTSSWIRCVWTWVECDTPARGVGMVEYASIASGWQWA